MSWLRISGLAVVALASMCTGCGGASFSQLTGTNLGAPQNTGFSIRTVQVDGQERKYGLFIPHQYKPTQQWPVIVFLHGALEGGSDGQSCMTVGLGPNIAKTAGNFGFITVFPQSPGDWTGEERAHIAIACLDDVQRKYSTDPGCVSLTGLSNGGQGTWLVGGRYSTRFSALVPMCAYASYESIPQISKLPIWAFHNSGDFLVSCGGTEEMCKRIKEAGGNVKFSKTDGMGHNCWDAAYDQGEVFKWMVSQRRGTSATPLMGSSR